MRHLAFFSRCGLPLAVLTCTGWLLTQPLASAETPPKDTMMSAVQPAGTLGISLTQEVQASLGRGLDWLAGQQQENGAWSNGKFPALTALALWPFIASQHPEREQIMERALKYISSCIQEDGGIYQPVPGRKGGGLSNYNTAICMTVLHATGRPEFIRAVQQARTFVAGGQHMGDDTYRGGFGYDRETDRPYTDLLNTFYSVEAMRSTESVEDLRPAGESKTDINWDAAVKFIESMQNTSKSTPDDAGGFMYNPSDPKAGTLTNAQNVVVFRSYGSMTYAGMLALVYARVPRDDPRVLSALQWASHHWSLDENPGMGAQGLYFFYNVLARSIDATGVEIIHPPNSPSVNWRQKLAEKIVSLQQTDPNGLGFWQNENNRYWENDPILCTAYALHSLQIAAGNPAAAR